MPRSKKATSQGRGRRGHVGSQNHTTTLATSFVRPSGARNNHVDENYALQSEALGTEFYQSPQDSDQRLRHAKIKFVIAECPDTKDHEAGLAHMTVNETSKELRRDGDEVSADIALNRDLFSTGQGNELPGTDHEAAKSFTYDINVDELTIPNCAPSQIRSASPTPSNSSDEVIVFAGRGLSKPPPVHESITDPYNSRITAVENDPLYTSQRPTVHSISRQQIVKGSETFLRTPQTIPQFMTEIKGTKDGPLMRARSNRRGKMKRDCKQAPIDDYISNMKGQGYDPELSCNQRDLGATESDPWQETEISLGDSVKKLSLNEWSHSGLSDFDAPGTSDEICGSVREILSKRNRKSGQQYLVVWEGRRLDEACWVPTSSLADINSMKLITEFEAKERITAEVLSEEEDSDDSDSDDGLASDEGVGDLDRDVELLRRTANRAANGKSAKRLAKQEGLGIGSSEQILSDDSLESDTKSGDMIRRVSKPNRHAFRYVPRVNLAKGVFPAATALADAYDGFDIMDFERPSLKKKPKGRRGRFAFGLSDSELEASMVMACEKNRSKKRARKEERHALRARGLLGKRDDKPDLKVKYKEGIGIHGVKDEIKSFLKGNDTTLALLPMDKADRKVIHELANAFGLKSKSMGNGNKRFPVLYRTTQTASFSETKFAAIEARLTRRYLPRMDIQGKNKTAAPKRSGQKGFANAAVSYRDGDIVGGSAPEIGIENKGRAMLEKMGWSSGTALGALNNKGILQPVSHVVKTSKAGLG